MKRCVVHLALLCLPWSLQPAEAGKPNIVVIVADDLGWNDVGWHGGRVRTPQLDRLCREGLELDQHYVSPMCSPTRAALLSGRYASRFGVTSAQNERVFPFGTPTLASALRQTGYQTALVGKWHLGSLPEWGPAHFGFDHSYGSLAGGCGPYNHKYKQGPYADTWHRDGRRVSEDGHITDLVAHETIRWIDGRGDEPFLLYVAFTAPHVPIKEPQHWLDQYPDIADPIRRQYAACVSHLDDAVGRIVAALDRTGRRSETLILFFSDNGGTQARNDEPQYPADDYTPGRSDGNNLPLRGKKTELYDGGIRVPAFVNWQGRLQPGRFTAPLHAADWMPTLSALAGCMPSTDLKWDGHNVWPWLTAQVSPTPRPLYWAGTGFRTWAVREGDWKLIVTRETGKAELFQLAEDPNEEKDLADTEPDRVRTLRDLMRDLAARDNDARATDE